MNVLVINGHPRNDSFSEALTKAYVEGAVSAGVTVHELKLADLSFDPNVIKPSPRHQYLEQGIVQAQQMITAADHLVFFYPTWWGTMPALLKAFFDRVLTPGYAFEEIEGGTGYAPMLRGKSAHLFTTMDTPVWVYQLIYRAPGHNAVKRATLNFCGISPVKTTSFSSVKNSTEIQRAQWLNKARNEGSALQNGAISRFTKWTMRALTWLKAIRLQFYPMTWIAYACGAYGAESLGYGFNSTIFWIGYLWLFFLEVATVLSNDYFDYATDKQNEFFSPFTGGSRVLVEKEISFSAMKKGIAVSVGLSFVALALLLVFFDGNLLSTAVVCAALIVLALGYTIPPLRLSYRGLGEINVGITHSFAVVVCGYIFQGGFVLDSFPWLLSVPLFLSILPSIILAGIPDRDADKAAGKKTKAVRFGRKNAATIALVLTVISAVVVTLFKIFETIPGVYSNAIYLVSPHAVLLVTLLYRYIINQNPPRRIDSLLVAALTYLMWFAIIPLLSI